MRIAAAKTSDIDGVMRLIADVVARLRQEGSDMWDERYPRREFFMEDISKCSLYLAWEGSEIVGVMALDSEQSPEYREVEWKVATDKVLVVHRLAVSPNAQGMGIASRMMDFAEDKARKEGAKAMRLDAYTGNPAALALYESRGYTNAGTVKFPWRTLPFNCYEKAL